MSDRSIHRFSNLKLAKLAKEPGMHCDGGNLFLQVQSETSRSWIFRYAVDGKRREMGLGRYPEITLAEAREKAAEARRQRAHGIDPLDAKRSSVLSVKAERAKLMTFKDAAAQYIEAHSPGWKNADHERQWRNSISTYVNPIVGDLSVAAINTMLVMRVLEPIWTTKPETASRLRGRIELILDWSRVKGYRDGDNPARWKGHLDKLLPATGKVKKATHFSALSIAALPSFVGKLRQENNVAALALEFAILTAARTGEVIGATWREINLSDKLWIIPGARMKAGREHRVPLCQRAVDILSKVGPGQPDAFLFKSWKGNLSNAAMLKLLGRMGVETTSHGFRSVFRNWCAERTEYPAEMAELALAHVVGSKVEQAYLRSDMFERRRAMMNDWAAFCENEAGARP